MHSRITASQLKRKKKLIYFIKLVKFEKRRKQYLNKILREEVEN